MCVVINAIGQKLHALVSIVLLNLLNKRDNRLYSLLDDENRRERLKRLLVWVSTIAISALAGGAISLLIRFGLGDG